MKSNNQLIVEKIFNEGYSMGIYDKTLNKLNKANLKKVLDNIRYTSDTKVFINRKPFIVEIDEINNEIDFNVIPLYQYESQYGVWED